MAWFKVDDKLHDHRKSRKAGKAAMGVWVLAGSWAMDNLTDGFVPADVLSRWGTRADAKRLVSAGLWREDEHEGEPGWRFHDWARFQPSAAVTAAVRAKEAAAGVLGNHKRWHVDRKITDPDCEYCHRVPDGEPDQVPDGVPESPPIPPVPVPDTPIKTGSAKPPRADVENICNHLAASVERRGAKRPTVTAKWRDAGRLMLDRDGYTVEQVRWLIDRVEADDFWSANVLSMPKLREKAEQLKIRFRPRAVSGGPLVDPATGEPILDLSDDKR